MGELIDPNIGEAIIKIDAVASMAQKGIAEAESQGQQLKRALIMASAMQQLRDLLSPAVMKDLMLLQNSNLGFKTDKPNGGYPVEIVRDVAIEAIIRGFRMIGNEVNIIASRLYVTREGFERVVRSWPGISHIEVEVFDHQVAGDVARVAAFARWKVDGRAYELDRSADRRVVVKVNNGMGPDAIYGKAKSKLYRLIHERLCGILTPTDDDDEDDHKIVDGMTVKPAAMIEPPVQADPNNPMPSWGKESSRLIAELDACGGDYKALKVCFDKWKPYASNEAKLAELRRACEFRKNAEVAS